MRSLFSLSFSFFFCHLIIRTSSQRIEGRYLRPNQPKCDRQSGCTLKDEIPADFDDKSHAYDADKHYPGEDYRSIGGDGRPHTNKDFKSGGVDDLKSGEEDFVYKPIREEPIHKIGTGGGYNRKPVIDRFDYVPKPIDPIGVYDSKDDSYIPSGIGGGYNNKPIRGSNNGYKPKPAEDIDHYVPKPVGGEYNPKPVVDTDHYVPKPVGGGYNPKTVDDTDHYVPKAVGGGYNPKPDEDTDHYVPKPVGGEYNPKPVDDVDPYVPKPVGTGYKPDSDDYVPRPTGDAYHPKPSLVGDDDFHKPGGGYRPKPTMDQGGLRPRPVPGGDYHKPTRPVGPLYPNKDLGGYYDSKDDDYNHDIGVKEEIKEEDYGKEVKPVPLEDGNCICVPYYQCQEGHIVTDGAGIIDARKRPEPDEELPLDGKFKPPTCGPFHVCCNAPETSTVKPYSHRCGVRNPSGINSRVLSPSNKGEADFGEWPWQAAVLKSEGKVNIFQCGGVLIDKFHVLTVAHCVFHLYKYNEYPLKVRLGEWDTQTTSEFLAHDDYRVSKIIVHPEYRNTSLWNDIAILKLEEAVLFAPHIDTICLPKHDEIFAEQNCVVTGWGKDAYKGGTFSNIMKEVALQVIDNYKCEEMLRKTRLGRFFNLHEGFLCAGGEYGLDSCKGDGGGPLVCYRKDKSYALAGIVSWGIDCGQPGVPGVYVKIQKYLEWISKNTGVDVEEYWPKH